MSKSRIAGLKSVIIVFILAVLIVFYYGHLTKKNTSKEEDVNTTSSAITNVLVRNLKTNYPATPKEVVKYFSDVTKCFYVTNITDEDIKKLADQLLYIYDDELGNNKDYEWYLGDLKQELNNNRSAGFFLSSYELSPSTDVEYFYENGDECARTWCTYNFKQEKYFYQINYVFILRKDANGHWRIFGWEQLDE